MKSNSFLWIFSIFLIAIMMLAPGVHGGVLFWFIFILGIFLLFNALFAPGEGDCGEKTESEEATDAEIAHLDALANGIISVNGRKTSLNVFTYEGPLRHTIEEVMQRATASLRPLKREFFLEDADNQEVRLVVLPPGPSQSDQATVGSKNPRHGVHWALFVTTLLTTTWAGAMHQGVNLLQEPSRFMVGLPYALSLMLILGAHEMGHYLTARRYRMNVTPPFFIPVPFALGTFGAFISMRTPPTSRRNLFDVAVAGPLAGLIVAIPSLLIGLPLSTLTPGNGAVSLMGGGVNLGSSILLSILAKFSMGANLLEAHNVILHPLAFAGWLGLLLTALNLLPIGQLDGGHIAQALVGSRRARGLSSLAMLGLFLLALFVWPGLLFFAFLVFFVAGRSGLPPRNDVSRLNLPRRLLGYFSFLLLILIITPLPHGWYENFGIHCPYV